MKSLQVDFVTPRAWLAVWAVAGLCALGITAWALSAWWPLQQALRSEQGKLEQLQKQLGQASSPTAPTASPKTQHAQKIAQALQFDLNKVFRPIEALKLPGVRLKTFNVDMSSASIRLEYEFDGLATAAVITENLNAGFDSPPWRLEGVSAFGNLVVSTGASGGNGTNLANTYRGTWTGAIGKL
jgi:hypothetical protein